MIEPSRSCQLKAYIHTKIKLILEMNEVGSEGVEVENIENN